MDQKLYTVIGIALVIVISGLVTTLVAGWIVFAPQDYGISVERFNVWMIVANVSIVLLMVGGSVRESGWAETIRSVILGTVLVPLGALFAFCVVAFTFGMGGGLLLFGTPAVCLALVIYLLVEKNYAWAMALILVIIDLGVIAYIGSGFSSFENLPYFRSYSSFWSGMFLLPMWGLATAGALEWQRDNRILTALYGGIVGGGLWWIITTFYMPYLVTAMD